MKAIRFLVGAWLYFCVASALAQLGLLAALWQRHLLTPATLQNLLTVAYNVPLRDIEAKLIAETQPARHEMVSFEEVQAARGLANLDLDIRDMSADKGLLDLRELDALVDQEKNRYSRMKDDFDQKWAALRQRDADTALQEVRRQIESIPPRLAKDQLVKVLEDKQLEPDVALQHVVTIFKGLTRDKRKKIVIEFLNDESPYLKDILREIRLGMPQSTLINEARQRMAQFRNEG
ncbi:MAG: hypothetical protein AB7F89_17535 [Pirellulaceae bacterium]